jgi:hypothetical protein
MSELKKRIKRSLLRNLSFLTGSRLFEFDIGGGELSFLLFPFLIVPFDSTK